MSVDHDAVVHLDEPTQEQMLRQRRHYYANITMIDEQIGFLLEALERRGVLSDTVVIFTSDHGDCLGDHGHSQKWNMYEPSVRVPAIFWGPHWVQRGGRIHALTSMMDIGPTILELAGLTPPSWMEAESLASALGGNAWEGRSYVFSEHARDRILTGTKLMTMVRHSNWKLVEFVDSDQGQLFDLESDPSELVNLWDSAEAGHRRVKRQLLLAIARWRADSSLHTADMWREWR